MAGVIMLQCQDYWSLLVKNEMDVLVCSADPEAKVRANGSARDFSWCER